VARRLGIGVSVPTYKLNVSAAAGAQNIFQAGQSGISNGLSITSDGTNLTYSFLTGNVGIGTSSPTAPLTVNGGTASAATIQLGNHNDNASIHGKYSLSFKADSTEAIADRSISFSIGTAANFALTTSTAIFNDLGADIDFRVESNTNDHALFVQGSDGNVGIGTSSPAYKTVISANGASGIEFGPAYSGTSNLVQHYSRSGGVYVDVVNEAAQHKFNIAGTTKMTLDASGDLTTTGAATFGGNVVGLTFESSVSSSSTNLATNSGGSLTLKNTSVTDGNFSNIGGYNSNTLVTSQINFVNVSQASRTGAITFNVHNGASMPEVGRFDASGNLLVGTTSVFSGSGITPLMTVSKSAGSGIGVNLIGSSEVGLATRPSAAHNYYAGFFLNNAGTGVGNITVGSSTTAYNTSSDERLKENITDANDAGDKIDAIKVRQYDWKADGSHQDYGMVAQELMTVAPEAVSPTRRP
jgi:hypothetical protein